MELQKLARRVQRDLHERIVGSQSSKSLIDSIKNAENIDSINKSTLLHKLGKFREKGNYFEVPGVLRCLNFEPCSEWKPRAISNSLWSLGKLEELYLSEGALQQLKKSELSGWSFRDISNAIWGLAVRSSKLELAHRHDLEILTECNDFLVCANKNLTKILSGLPPPKSQEIAVYAWSAAKLDSSRKLDENLLKSALDQLSKFTDQDISMLFWAMAQTDSGSSQTAKRLTNLITRRLIQSPNRLSLQCYANITWAFSILNRKMNKILFDKLRTQWNLEDFTGEQVSAVLLSFARENSPIPDGLPKWDSMKTRELLNVIWALSRYVYDGKEYLLLEGIERLSTNREELSPQDIYAVTRVISLAYTYSLSCLHFAY
jgi:hypothetical protein